MGHRYVNGSVQWIDVPRPFGETGIVITDWTENTLVYGWGTNTTVIPNHPIRRCTTFQSVPITLRGFACQANHDRLTLNRVEQRQPIEIELHARILLEICDKVLSDASSYDGWLKESD